MRSTIITIGDEILIGQIVDTNSASISRHLNKAGIVVYERLSIGDDANAIVEAVERAMERTEVVIITGGLGPTKDDITKTTLAKLFHGPMRYDEEVAHHVESMLAKRGVVFNELNRGQAMVPECCDVLFNRHGTAPGMWFDHPKGVVISLPGVPFEMEHLMADEVMPRLTERFSLRSILHRTLITAGLAESMLAERISEWEESLPEYLRLAYLPAPGVVRLRLSAYEVEGERVAEEIECRFKELERVIGEYIVGYENASVESLIHQRLTDMGRTLSVAESCTGGAISSRFTAMPGASAYFLAGVVAYQNAIKESLLGVKSDSLREWGAVSEAVARQMAEGIRKVSGSDYALSTTGIAGPTGGSDQKPVGTVWIALATPQTTVAQLYQCGTDRSQIIGSATTYALQMLEKELRREAAK